MFFHENLARFLLDRLYKAAWHEASRVNQRATEMRARKVSINHDSSSIPERFYTAHEAQVAADECNIPGEICQVIVGCLRPKYYVLLIDDGEAVKYYSALSETWIPVSCEVAEAEAIEPEVKSLECEGVSVNSCDGSERRPAARVIHDDEREVVRKLQAVLIRIDKGERFFFNIITLESRGLIKGIKHYCNNSCGQRELANTTWHLTEKGKQLCNVVI